MNKYQRLVVIAAVINLLLIFLFPPFSDQPLARGALPSFDGFYPLLTKFGNKPIHTELLTLQVMFVLINLLAAWLVLEINKQNDFQAYAYGRAIALFVLVNLLVIFAFPPFEPYNSLLRQPSSSFDSFYFVFGNRSARPIFAPLLYIECIFILVNALAIYLLFNAIQRGESTQKLHLLDIASKMSEKELAQLNSSMRAMVEEHKLKTSLAGLGRHQERRLRYDPRYRGPERRARQRRHD